MCCLGLDSAALMPSLLRELHAFIPSCGNSFFWCDARGGLASIYDETPESRDIGPLYLAEFYNRRERELYPGFTEAMHSLHGVVRKAQLYPMRPAAYHRSDLYNLIMRPLGYDSIIQLYVREHGRPLGCLNLQRGPGETDFSAAEARRLAGLLPFVAHALSGHDDPAEELVDTRESGLVIADHDGHLVSQSPEGRELLQLATRDKLKPGTRAARRDELPLAAATLCRRLDALFAGATDAAAPVATHRNSHGRFTFRAYDLPAAESRCEQVGITITREVPLALRLMEGTRELPLSRRQREIAVFLAAGMTHEQIATRLDIKRNTAVSHARWVYAKLEVHDSAELRHRLLAQAAA